MRIPPILTAALVLLAGATAASAQSEFGPALTVNGHQITGFELEQRVLFLKIIGTKGDLEGLAETALIEDRLRQAAAKRAGIKLTAEQVRAGMEEFAGRANLDAEKFIAAIGQGGVQAETFRDFVSAGLAWREVIRGKFGNQAVIGEAQVERALSTTASRGAGIRVLVSEIIIPAVGGDLPGARDRAIEIAATIRSEGDFDRAAREASASPSRLAGGRLGWMPLTNLPAAARGAMLQLRPGQVSPPIALQDAVALFQLRGVQQGGDIRPSDVTVDYATFAVAGGADGADIRARATTCDDLYPIARATDPARLTRQTVPERALPGDIAGAMAALDDNESALVTRGGSPVVVMLCARRATMAEGGVPEATPGDPAAETSLMEDGTRIPKINPDFGFGNGPSRDDVRGELVNQRLSGLADAYLEELKADAVITRP